jgi:hypothetical protein
MSFLSLVFVSVSILAFVFLVLRLSKNRDDISAMPNAAAFAPAHKAQPEKLHEKELPLRVQTEVASLLAAGKMSEAIARVQVETGLSRDQSSKVLSGFDVQR